MFDMTMFIAGICLGFYGGYKTMEWIDKNIKREKENDD